MAHLDVCHLPLFVAGAKLLQPPSAILIIEQRDVMTQMLLNNVYLSCTCGE
ncbi:MAG: hypothetical protein OWQ51_09410 [Pyrobaculum arsenaticum]|jgi:hypothetical protein|uniref:hypothetical protein n=1 Tax=Pyrobaculum arsenaticum TaxID=121277 RepID=UPI000A4D9A61|nr:hypothetical protein [Pyrobaculum arsenaticum]MCY0891172.1 hypothetical protein [Pyrobaculum arsenaticum]